MKIPFSEISSSGSIYTLKEPAIQPTDAEFSILGGLKFSCSLVRKKANRVVLDGLIQADVQLSCDRCAASYVQRVQTQMQVIYEVVASDHWKIKDIDRVVVNLDVVELIEPVIDLEAIAWEQLALSLPIKRICGTECRGICPECGCNLNTGSCGCEPVGASNPFGVLAALKNRK